MKEFLELLKRFDWEGLFITPTKNVFLQFFRYVFVGGIATVVDWGILFLLTDCGQLHYMLSKVIATVIVLAWNYIARKLIVYK